MAGHFVTPTTLIPQILIGSLQLGLDYYCERKIQSSPRGGGLCAFLRMFTEKVYRLLPKRHAPTEEIQIVEWESTIKSAYKTSTITHFICQLIIFRTFTEYSYNYCCPVKKSQPYI